MPKNDTLLKSIGDFDTATLYEAAGQQGAMVPEMRPLSRGMRVVGPACTVACPPGDNLMLHAGVVVLPAAGLPEVLEKARARQEREAKLMADVRGGKTTLELLALTPLLDDVKEK